MNIIQKPTPNYTEGRGGIIPSVICIHWIGAGTPQGAIAWFANPSSQVSAHYLVAGKSIYQFVEEEDVAWHSGDWKTNTESIGIEHYATPDHPASDDTYNTSAELVKDICKRYNIPIDREHIIKHSEVKSTACPGTLDVDRIISLAKEGGAMVCEIKDSSGKVRAMEWLLREWEVEKKRADELDKEVDSYKDKVNELSDEIGDVRNQLEATDKRWKEIENNLREQINLQAGTILELEKDKTSLIEARSALGEEINVLRLECEGLQKENEDLKNRLDNVLVNTPLRSLVWVIIKRLSLKGGGR